jgi:hypothetical protein
LALLRSTPQSSTYHLTGVAALDEVATVPGLLPTAEDATLVTALFPAEDVALALLWLPCALETVKVEPHMYFVEHKASTEKGWGANAEKSDRLTCRLGKRQRGCASGCEVEWEGIRRRGICSRGFLQKHEEGGWELREAGTAGDGIFLCQLHGRRETCGHRHNAWENEKGDVWWRLSRMKLTGELKIRKFITLL